MDQPARDGHGPAPRASRGDVDVLPEPPSARALSTWQRIATLVPWATWAATVVVAAVVVQRYGRRYPYSDDWNLVPFVTGERGVSLGWLWEPTSEHRLVVLKLVLPGVLRLGGADFRSGSWLNLVLLAVLAAAAILTMRRVRGHSSVGDAFFPLVFLAPQIQGLTWGYHVHFVTTSVAAVTVLLVMTRFGLDVPAGWLWLATACCVVLLGEGAPGLAMLPALGVWLVLSARRLRTSDRRQATAILGATGLVAVGMVLYFVGWPGSTQGRPALVDAAVTAVRAATVPGGDSMSNVWPLSGVAVVVGLAATAAVVVWQLWRPATRNADHGVAVAFACFGVAMLALVVAIGWGRGNQEWIKGLEHHYSDLMLALAAWAYVVWDRFARSWRAVVGVAFLAAAVAVYAVNAGRVVDTGREQRRQEVAFRADLCAGDPVPVVAERYLRLFHFTEVGKPRVIEGIRALRADDVAGFTCDEP